MWGRLSPHPAFEAEAAASGDASGNGRSRRRVRPTRVAPVTFFLREDAGWLVPDAVEAGAQRPALSHAGRAVLEQLTALGASFLRDLVRATGRLASEVEDGLWELAAAGLVTADGFDNLRALIDPKRRRGEGRFRAARPRHAAGRWALLRTPLPPPPAASRAAAGTRVESFARQLLARWGVVFRDLIAREALAPPWRELLRALRTLEARGEIRGGRFVDGFLGEQFARPEAVDALRSVRRAQAQVETAGCLRLSAADPLNLVGPCPCPPPAH
jgi:ATP-dependent Lhr-like helicase